MHAARPALLPRARRRDGGDDHGPAAPARAWRRRAGSPVPVIAVNEARTERLFNDHYGTGQSTLDGILRATNLLLAGRTIVVLGYGLTGKGVALRARGAGAQVIVCEVDPMRALEARMEGFEVMPALEAAARGDVFVTVTGNRDVSARRALRAHEGRRGAGQRRATSTSRSTSAALRALAVGRAAGGAPARHAVRPRRRRRLNLLASGRVVNLAAGQGHPAAVMDMSFANQALAVEHLVRSGRGARARRPPGAGGARPRGRPAQARLARRGDRRARPADAGALPAGLARRRVAASRA